MNSIKGWKNSTVKDLCYLGRGRVISGQEIEQNPGIYPVYSSQSKDHGKMGVIDTFDFDGEYVTWTTDGAYAGTVFYRNGKFNCTNVCGTLSAKEPELDLKFLAYKLSTVAKNYVSYVGNPKLMNGIMAGIEIDLPERKIEQTKIAEVLSTVDRAIEQTEALIAKQQRIKTGLMQDLLTKGIDAHGNIRSESTHAFKDSPLGRIPVEWEVAPISAFQLPGRPFIKTGPFGSSLNTKHWVEDGVPVITIGSLGESGFLKQELLYVSKLTAHALSPYRVKPGDIVFSRVADIGRALVITAEQNGWIISSNFMRISLNESEVSPSFLYRSIVFNSATRDQLRVLSNASGREVVNTAILSALDFAWPDLDEQNRLNDKLDQIDGAISKSRYSLEKLVSLKRGLMHDLLTGKRRVTPLLATETDMPDV